MTIEKHVVSLELPKQKYMRHLGKIIVWANHPAMPSDSPKSRGRKKHLAISAESGTKTLCNMLVDCEFGRFNQDNGMCQICSKKARV